MLRDEQFLEVTLKAKPAEPPAKETPIDEKPAEGIDPWRLPECIASAKCKSRCVLAFCNLQFAFCNLQFFCLRYAQDNDSRSLEAREEAALQAAAESVAPSVVQIRTIGGLESVEGTLLADGPTTGLVISPDGYIISSAFNFVQQPASILVTFASGKQAPAELVATDHSRMLVLLKANGVADLPVPTMAPLDEIRPGQWAIAVGRTFRADARMSRSASSAPLGRMFGKAIQTDADVSTANYGGPLVDIRGRVLGVIVPMAPQGDERSRRRRMVRLRHRLRRAARRLRRPHRAMKKGEDQRPGLLGIGMTPKNPHSSPAELAAVRPDSPAGKAGFKKGDRIVEIDGKPIKTQTDLRFALGTAYGGDDGPRRRHARRRAHRTHDQARRRAAAVPPRVSRHPADAAGRGAGPRRRKIRPRMSRRRRTTMTKEKETEKEKTEKRASACVGLRWQPRRRCRHSARRSNHPNQ